MVKANRFQRHSSAGKWSKSLLMSLATPNPDWLSFINTQKARRALQNILRDQDIEEQRLVGSASPEPCPEIL